MRPTRLVAGLATTGLVALSPVLVAAAGPASAAPGAALTSSITVSPPTGKHIRYGDDLLFSGQVTASDGSYPDTGVVSLQIQTPGTTTWTTIATDDDSLFDFDVKAVSNAAYQVVYPGGTSYDSTSGATNSVTPSTSAPIGLSVQHKVILHTSHTKVIGKVTPNFAKGKVKIYHLVGKKKIKFATVRANKSGRFVFRAPARNEFHFLVVIAKSALFAQFSAAYTVYAV